MIQKINIYMISNKYPNPVQTHPSFCGYLNRTANKKLSTGGNFIKTIRNFFSSFKNFVKSFNLTPDESPRQIDINNKFIANIQKKLKGKYLPLGSFELNQDKSIHISRYANGNKKIEIRDENDSFVRSTLVDRKNNILEYKTSFPWRIFVKTDKGFQSCDNINEYTKQIASDPFYFNEFLPRL